MKERDDEGSSSVLYFTRCDGGSDVGSDSVYFYVVFMKHNIQTFQTQNKISI